MIKTKRDLLVFCFSMAFTQAGSLLAMTMFHLVPYPLPAIVYVPGLLVAAVLSLALLFGAGAAPPTVDAWALQRQVMLASNQQLPRETCITRGTVLYLALCLEELAETMDPVCHAFGDAVLPPARDNVPLPYSQAGLRAGYNVLVDIIPALQGASKALRSASGRMAHNMELSVSDELEEQLADGVTDMAVVVAGLAESSGLPGAALYREVAESNLSKRNPRTLGIDLDPSGKWIKGVNYQEPDIRAVLSLHARTVAMQRR